MFQKRRKILGKCFLRFKKGKDKKKESPKERTNGRMEGRKKEKKLTKEEKLFPWDANCKMGWLRIEA